MKWTLLAKRPKQSFLWSSFSRIWTDHEHFPTFGLTTDIYPHSDWPRRFSHIWTDHGDLHWDTFHAVSSLHFRQSLQVVPAIRIKPARCLTKDAALQASSNWLKKTFNIITFRRAACYRPSSLWKKVLVLVVFLQFLLARNNCVCCIWYIFSQYIFFRIPNKFMQDQTFRQKH